MYKANLFIIDTGLPIFRGKKARFRGNFRGKFAEKSADFAGKKSKFAQKLADFTGNFLGETSPRNSQIKTANFVGFLWQISLKSINFASI